jgi:hypothetical protein
MSHCEIIAFRNNKADREIELRNAWGGHAMVWTVLFDLYLKNPHKEYDSWITQSSNDSPLWKLHRDPRLAECERAVLVSTYDHALIMQKDFERFTAHLREFLAQSAGVVSWSHLPAYDQFICENMDAQAIGFYGTSVAEDPWREHDEETDEWVQYDLSTGEKHFDVYDVLAEVADATEGRR